MDDYDDYYQEPSKFEEVALAMKEATYDLVRDDLKNEITGLRTRNAELEARHRKLDELEREAKSKISTAEYAAKNAERKAMSARFEEIVDMFGKTYYAIGYKTEKRPKCDKCNPDRYIEAVAASGQVIKAGCDCNTYDSIYSAHEVQMFKVPEKSVWRYIQWTKDTYGDVEFGDRCVRLYKDEDFTTLRPTDYIFDDSGKAEEFVAYLNRDKS